MRSLTRHFDWLVREAEIDARDAARHIAALAERLSPWAEEPDDG